MKYTAIILLIFEIVGINECDYIPAEGQRKTAAF